MKTKTLIYLLLIFFLGCGKTNTTIVQQNGKSGSTARMVIVNNFMYVVDHQNLKTFDISVKEDPKEVDKKEVGFGIETIFPFASYLFIGSTDGMYIYNISNPANPITATSQHIQHFSSCDPVVANNNFAYVTLNTNVSSCNRSVEVNELQIVDIQDILNPTVVNKIQMEGPKGLGLDGNNLFICDKTIGVVVFDLTNPESPVIIDTISGFTANDIIPNNGNLLVICNDGLRQFNYSNIDSIYLTSLMDL